MYSPSAIARRKCTATRKDGQPCQGWARWGDPAQRCAPHSVPHRGPMPKPPIYNFSGARYTPCTCDAYSFPHRPGGGLCRWPDVPEYQLTTPAGTHGDTWQTVRSWPALRLLQRREAKYRRMFRRNTPPIAC